MIYNDKEYLPLEEAVQELVRLVEGHYSVDRVIADFGITMVNQPVPDPSYLDGVKGTQWGEAYPVGYRSPYDIYIWTRPTADTTNVADGTWFNVGPLAIPGPQGPKGEQGEQGDRGHSTRWYFGDSVTEVASPMPGDVFMNRDGVLFMYDEIQGWGLPIISIRGPQGPQGAQGRQGPQGPQGPQGQRGPIGESLPAIVLLGKLTSVDLLPTPSASYVGRGYIVTTGDINMIYTVFEDESQSGQYSWSIAGTLSGFSIITAGGAVVPQFDADTKLDKVASNASGISQAYVVDTAGNQVMIGINPHATDWTIARRYDGGRLRVATPVADNDSTTKAYVDNNFVQKIPPLENGAWGIYTCKDDGSAVLLSATTGTGGSIPLRGAGGVIGVGTPTANEHAATKKYVDDLIANNSPKLYRHSCIFSAFGNFEGSTEEMRFAFEFICSNPKSLGFYDNFRQNELINMVAGSNANSATIFVNGEFVGQTLGLVTFERGDFGATIYNIEGFSNYFAFEETSITDYTSPIL